MFDKLELKTLYKTKEVINRQKRSKKLNYIKPVQNINNNMQSFLQMRPVQKQVLPSHNLQDHAYK